MRRILFEIPRIAAALFLGLVLCELGLRVAAWAAQRGTGRAERVGEGPALVCYGDSNVFGIYEHAEDSYPGRLQAWIDRRGADGPRVVNRGLPGLSTRHVLARVTEELEEAQPLAVLVSAGVNNAWAWLPDARVEAQQPPWLERLRITRLLRLLYASTQSAPAPSRGEHRILLDPETGQRSVKMIDRNGEEWTYPGRTDSLGTKRFRESVREDLEALHALTSAAGVPLLLVAYGSNDNVYGQANAVLRKVGRDLSIPVADAAVELEELAALHGADRVFYPDQHPRALGYEVIARAVHDQLVELGILPGPPVGDLLADLALEAAGDPIRLVGTLGGSGADELAVEVSGGEPGREFSLVLWALRDPGEPYTWKSFGQLKGDPLFEITSKAPQLTGRFDHNGHARLSLAFLTAPGSSPGDVEERFSGKVVRACYLLYTPGRKDGLALISEETELVIP